MTDRHFIEIDYFQKQKCGQRVCGDVFLSQKSPADRRTVSVLSDGLGSGIKANVLATLTSAMATRFIANKRDVVRSASIIMATLPVCKVRKIGYSTFSVVDMNEQGETSVLEHGNPAVILVREGRIFPLMREELEPPKEKRRKHFPGGMTLYYSRFQAEPGDRIVMLSDGISQSGMGQKQYPLGWGEKSLAEFVLQKVNEEPSISASALSRALVERADVNDQYKAKDDMTCGVIYLREPRRTLVLAGPPFNRGRDAEIARMVFSFSGKKVICGGTTANIIARELALPIHLSLDLGSALPPTSSIEGFDLITEGTITLAAAAELLESGVRPSVDAKDAASRLVLLLLDSDIIEFRVGTRVNEAHQDPSFAQSLELRRNLVRRICVVLEGKYLKKAFVEFQ